MTRSIESLMQTLPRGPDAAPGDWPPTIKHLSASSLSTFSTCPEKFRRQYVQRVPQQTVSGFLLWGRVDHAAITRDLQHRMDYGTGLSTSDVLDVFSDEWKRELTDNPDVLWDEGETAGSILDKGIKLVSVYHREVCPTLQPIALEKKHEASFAGSPVPVIGYIDIETPDSVIDRKTSGKRVNTPKPDWWPQKMIYTMFVPKPVEWHVSVKTKAPYVMRGAELTEKPVNPIVTKAWIGMLASQIAHCYSVFGPDDPWPGQGRLSTYACDYCAYRPSCDWWAS
jgi:hypothetical protein